MSTPTFTHKSRKITILITDSYKQLFVLITMLLTVLSVQPLTLTMAAPLPHNHYNNEQFMQSQAQLLVEKSNFAYETNHHRQLQEILLAETQPYRHDRHHRLNNNYKQHNYYHLQPSQSEQMKKVVEQQEQEQEEEEERLHKREISWHDYYNSIMQSQVINWYNPCGGISKMDEKPVKRKRPPPIKKELRKLQNTIAKNYNLIKGTLHVINIRNMKQWDLMDKYSFLPKLNINSSISLRRWHRQTQIYVAAFEYLRRAQLHFDYTKDSQESSIARELYELMKDARNILCNIELAINNTTTHKSASTIDSLFLSRTKMEDILKFTTDIKYISPLKWSHIKMDDDRKWEVDVFDLRFAKSQYFAFVRKLMKILRRHTKGPGPIYLGKKANKIYSNQQQQQQQRHQKKMKNSRKKFD